MAPAYCELVGAPLDLAPNGSERGVVPDAARRQDDGITARTFFHDGAGLPWKDADAFRECSMNCAIGRPSSIRTSRPSTMLAPIRRIHCGCPTKKLTMRTMRHTCITLNHDAGVPRELIRAITGHELDTID